MRSERSALRALLRLCRSADREPVQLVALLGRPPRLYNPETNVTVKAPASASPFVDEAVWEACGGSTEYSQPIGSAASAARRYYRRACLMGSPDLAEMRSFGKQIVASRMIAVKLGAVPSAIGPVRPESQSISSVREQKSQWLGIRTPDGGRNGRRPQVFSPQPSTLSRVPADCKSPLRAGDFIISHPLSGLFQPVFDQAVVAILGTDLESDTAQAVIVNKPGGNTLGSILAEVPGRSTSGTLLGPDSPGISWDELSSNALIPFLDSGVFQGGPIVHETLDDSMLWLHTHGKVVPDSWEIAPSLFLGGDLGLIASLEHATHKQGQSRGLRFFRGFSAWSLSQLEIELERGIWIRARADCASAAFEMCLGSAEPESVWRFALEAVGLPALARFPRGPSVDKTLVQVVEEHQRARAAELFRAGRA